MHDDFTKQLTERFAGLRLTIDKDGSVTDQNISNEKKRNNLKGPIRIRWKGRFDLRCERLFWKPSTVDACLVFGLDVYIYMYMYTYLRYTVCLLYLLV